MAAAILFGAPGADAQTFASVALLLTAVALAACWIPALRATRIDPLLAFKQE